MVPAKRVFLLVLLILSFATITTAPSRADDLTEALKLRDVARVQSLLAAGADVNKKVHGDYPINIAALFGPPEMVTLLLNAGAGLEQSGRDGLHPLHNAVISGRREIVALLIQKGAVVDAKDDKGRTPLISFAANAGKDIEIARMLLAAGADPKIEQTAVDKFTALDYAALLGSVELGELLLSAHVDPNYRNGTYWGDIALTLAASHSHVEFARMLLAHGADVNLADKQGYTPLGRSASEINRAMRQLLIEAGAK